MSQGRGRQLLGIGIGAVVIIAIGIIGVAYMGNANAYLDASAETARIRQDDFDGFFGCALTGNQPTQLSAGRVQKAFEDLGERLGKSYEKTLRACLPKMMVLSESVQTLRVPDAAQAERERLVTATEALVAANADYLAYLSKAGADDGQAAALPMLEKLGEAWGGYDTADTALRVKLRE